ncbi:transcriptional repressor [Helcobacillus massiliensis]|uniref:Fur family ferric uptake transcriptional regulator n=1 Tax=Helcobacillus massiliensis TaxID=521392 RepID=A0A839QUW6_9MICO|nr:Fur family transcriptional regulator [Helcobacillus massiliensis]MBB3023872.1 Fur family ferric uptake transcriptional regulator [Helcobacillus massiliensis]MCT1556538.1 transcriptional repressor [Helcobacillus massiliensis]MCT2035732.1 transcriptional repressor [Helcobacillus massiliensis]MCT2331186.1 transcriptional repressor [Helcobacillus massiliensis]
MTASLTAAERAGTDWVQALRDAGLRVTAPRIAALEVLASSAHVDAEVIAAEVRAKLGAVSKQAVYDVLAALTDAGLARKVSLDGRRALYELHRHDNHHHLVCRRCGRLEDVPCAVGEAPCIPIAESESHGFAVDEAEVTYRGLCPDCAARS